MRKPIIIIPASSSEVIADGIPEIQTPRFHLYRAYADAIKKAGGIAFVIFRPDDHDVAQILKHADGLLLAGGTDIHPKRYGEEVSPNCGPTDHERDRIEFALLKHAKEMHIPILAICRGMQLLNAYQGGTQYQDLTKELPGAIAHDFATKGPRDTIAHNVSIIDHTKLANIAGVSPLSVNSLHHQGVKVLGNGLTANALAPDGLIEGFEINDYPYGLGVQWHPEELHDAASEAIIRTFIEAATPSHKAPELSPMRSLELA